MSWLFGKKKSPIADEAKRNAEACKKALKIIQRCNSIGDKEIKQLAETLQPVNPDMDRIGSEGSREWRTKPTYHMFIG